MPSSIKISDTNQLITQGSKADAYWQRRKDISAFFSSLRPGYDKAILPNPNINMAIEVAQKYQLGAIGFGNWVNVQDRINYIDSLVLSLSDMAKVLRFKKDNLGAKQTLKVAFGGRGKARALAHYEPATKIINLTRYKRAMKEERGKAYAFLRSGGVGSFAHEYGHFLDYYAGEFLFQDSAYLAVTGGRSISTYRLHSNRAKPPKIRVLCDDFFEAMIWASGKQPPQNTPFEEQTKLWTPYYKQLRQLAGKNVYWFRRNELFARYFEQYIQYKLNEQGIRNYFLVADSYDSRVYVDKPMLQKLAPIMDKIIAEMRKKI